MARASNGKTVKNRGAMGPTFDEMMAKLPARRRAKIEARAQELVREELTLRDLRKALELTQVRLAKSLKTTQNQVSRIEQRTDLLLSTLRSYVEAMGGSLNLVAEFPDKPPVSIAGLADLGAKAAKRNTSGESRVHR